MARPLRIAVPGGLYHVYARGNARQPVFVDDVDRRSFLELLAEVLARFRWRCLTYCLMGNHYHLAVTTEAPDLSRGVRQLNGVYAQRFNRRYERCGHLWQGRFGATLVERDSHLRELARYIALNPVAASLCSRPEEWRWGAHRALVGLTRDDLVSEEELLSHFGKELARARASYGAFVASDTGGWQPESGAIAGTPPFLADHLPEQSPSPEIARRQWRPDRPPLEMIFAPGDLDSGIVSAYRDHGYTMREIAEFTGYHYATVSRRLRRFEADEAPEAETRQLDEKS